MIKYYEDEPTQQPPTECSSGMATGNVDLNSVPDHHVEVPRQPTPSGLQDTSPMPFGLHKGKPMQDVPASYLHWFYTTQKPYGPSGVAVYDYIKRNVNALKEEYPDGIWKPK